ncbi:hotdog fold thioesterase [Nesterenkonia alba]|uniref:hotdog fold thioesterase n=1 Tax=Nesterenkonia alba TaxID=515814 RepID=UPI000A00C139|nr:hotdog fold thioesterase [Nesterenkonia alba]
MSESSTQTESEQTAGRESTDFRPGFVFRPGPTPAPEAEEREARMAAMGIPEEYRKWYGVHGVPPLSAKLGMVFEHMSPDKLVATMPVGSNEQNIGILHGGAHLALAETMGSLATLLHIRANLDDMERVAVGIELNATHHRQIREGLVRATCTPVNLGRQLASHEIVMRDESHRRLSTARMTNMIIHPRR